MALTARSVKGRMSVVDSQSWSSSPWLCGASFSIGSSPSSVIDITTDVREMPSPMQWWMRTSTALPPS